jgi:predicted SprT family Zn-dependent metalloprotease
LDLLFSIPPIGDEDRLQFLYDRLAARFGFGAAVVRLSNRKLTGGEIRYGRPHRITISAHLTPAQREDTLRHEAAHAWAFQLQGARVAHGRVFQRLADKLGVSAVYAPETSALKEFRDRRQITYRCEGCGQLFRRFRPFRGARQCLSCWRSGRPSRLRKVKGDR